MKLLFKVIPLFMVTLWTLTTTALAQISRFEIDDEVLTPNGLSAKVVDVDSDGVFSVTVPGYSQTRRYRGDELISTSPHFCLKDFCPGQRVATEDGEEGVIAGISRDGFAFVKIEGHYSSQPYRLESLGLTTGRRCHQALCLGEVVKLSGELKGKVVAITGNEQILVRVPEQFKLVRLSPAQVLPVDKKECGLEDCLTELEELLGSKGRYQSNRAQISQSESKNYPLASPVWLDTGSRGSSSNTVYSADW